MSEILYIRLASHIDHVFHWLIWSPSQQEIIASGELSGAEKLSELAEKSKSRQVVCFVPSHDVALKSLKIPGKSQRAFKQAAPYMLEDELAQDVDQLFFAYADMKNNSHGHNCFLAALDRNKMQQWLHWLKEADIQCKMIVPDVLALPYSQDTCSAVMINNQVIIRSGEWSGFTLDASTWSVVAENWLRDLGKTLHHYSALPPLQQHKAEANNNDKQDAEIAMIAQPEELPLALMAQHYSSSINLLQGDFAIKSKRSQAFKHWLWAASLCGIALLLNLVMKGATLWQLSHEQQAVEVAIIETYKKAFPKTKRVRVSTIKSQLKSKLSALGTSGDNTGFLPMLVELKTAFANVPQLKPESLKFDGKRKEIRVQAVAKDYQSFDKFKTELEKVNLVVTQGAQNNQGDQISGSLSIKERS